MLPSPESEGFVGEGEGRFPLGGLSDIPDSLQKTRQKNATLQNIYYELLFFLIHTIFYHISTPMRIILELPHLFMQLL